MAAVSAAACTRQDAPHGAGSVPTAGPIRTSLSTSVNTTAGTWAIVPMGHLDDPLNTFWQLFLRPAGSSSLWSDQVEATAVATNGGLVLASSKAGSLAVGILPSDLLKFSPLIATADAGRSWSNGLIPQGLAANPNALAAGPSGQALALVVAGTSTQVVSSSAQLSGWHTLATPGTLASSPGTKVCDVRSLDAVAYAASDPVVAASCAQPGTVGIFAQSDGRWRPAAPILPAPLAGDAVQVLALRPAGGGLVALLALSGVGRPASLAAAWTGGAGDAWNVSAGLHLNAGEQVASVGPTTGGGLFTLLSSASGADRLETLAGAGSPWKQLPSPPAGTATVAFSSLTNADALAVDNNVLTVWTLRPSSVAWTKGQVIEVPIQFGSSN